MWPEPWASINRERRRRKVAQFPDLPHPYRARKVTARQYRGHGGEPDPYGGRLLLRSWYGGKAWVQPLPCRVCGASPGHKNHAD